MRKKILCSLFCLAIVITAQAQNELSQRLTENLRKDLEKLKFNKEAIDLMKNISKKSCDCLEEKKTELEKNAEEVFAVCIGQRCKKEFEKLAALTHQDDSVLAELVSRQLIADGCKIFIEAITKNLQSEQEIDIKAVDEATLVKMKAMNLGSDALPIIKEIDKKMCACLETRKAQFEKLKDMDELGEKFGSCFEDDPVILEHFTTLSKMSGSKMEQGFAEKIGKLIGERMAGGTCSVFLEIISKNAAIFGK